MSKPEIKQPLRFNIDPARAIPKLVLGLGLVVLAAESVHVATNSHSQPSPKQVFEKTYTQQGGCLDNTPYDPSNGAQLLVRHFTEADSLIVIPDFANSPIPPVLYLSVESGQIHPRDHQTESILVKSGCINATKA